MKFKLKNQNSKSLMILLSIVCYWFYLNICLGYFLSKIFYSFFDEINEFDFSKNIQFRKKFNLKTIKNFVISYILEFFENWIKRINKKYYLALEAINGLIESLNIFRNKFKSIFKFKYNLRLLKKLLFIFGEVFQVIASLVNEVFFIHSIIRFLIKWKEFISFLIHQSVLISRIICILYIILLGLLGVLLGFLLDVYKKKDDIYVFILLLLLQMFYNNGFDYNLLKPNKIDKFSRFSLGTVKQINLHSPRLILKKPDQILLPFLIIEDPFVFIQENGFVFIETEVLWDESINYKFELFELYQNLNQKVKS